MPLAVVCCASSSLRNSPSHLRQGKSFIKDFMRQQRKSNENFEESLLQLVRTLPKVGVTQYWGDGPVAVGVCVLWELVTAHPARQAACSCTSACGTCSLDHAFPDHAEMPSSRPMQLANAAAQAPGCCYLLMQPACSHCTPPLQQLTINCRPCAVLVSPVAFRASPDILRRC